MIAREPFGGAEVRFRRPGKYLDAEVAGAFIAGVTSSRRTGVRLIGGPPRLCQSGKDDRVVSGFIPAGRTSLVRRGDTQLQVQTEYAHRPFPRITTTILKQGQVLHKVEKKLEHAIASIEEQNLAEDVMKRQHAEVLSLIQDPSGEALQRAEEARNEPTVIPGKRPGMDGPGEEPYPDLPDLTPPRQDAAEKLYQPAPPPIERKESLHDRFQALPDFEHAFAVTPDGYFKSEAMEEQFRKAFKRVHKEIRELVKVFPERRGTRFRREEGVIEVERDRLYLVSTGEELFFITIRPSGADINYEKVIKRELFPDELQIMLQKGNRTP